MCLLLTKLIENKQALPKEKNNKQVRAEGNEQVSSEEENDLWYLMIVQKSTTKVYKQLLILFWDTRFRSKHCQYAFQQKFSVDGASWILDPSKETVNCKIKHTNNKFAV